VVAGIISSIENGIARIKKDEGGEMSVTSHKLRFPYIVVGMDIEAQWDDKGWLPGTVSGMMGKNEDREYEVVCVLEQQKLEPTYMHWKLVRVLRQATSTATRLKSRKKSTPRGTKKRSQEKIASLVEFLRPVSFDNVHERTVHVKVGPPSDVTLSSSLHSHHPRNCANKQSLGCR
jgi:hypothetical protein